MLQILIVVGMLVCALRALRTQRLLLSALWLAGASALLALLMYMLGAPEVAVIELSVGAGLVTVLFIFAINITGEEDNPQITSISRPLAAILVLLAAGLIGWLAVPEMRYATDMPLTQPFREALWEGRILDVILQVVLIFAGTLAVIGMLSETPAGVLKEKES